MYNVTISCQVPKTCSVSSVCLGGACWLYQAGFAPLSHASWCRGASGPPFPRCRRPSCHPGASTIGARHVAADGRGGQTGPRLREREGRGGAAYQHSHSDCTTTPAHYVPARWETTMGCALGLVNCERLARGWTKWAESTYWHTSCRARPATGATPVSFEVMGRAGRMLGRTGLRQSPSKGTRRLKDSRAARFTLTLESVRRGVKASKICKVCTH